MIIPVKLTSFLFQKLKNLKLSENNFIATASKELLNNLIIRQNILEKFAKTENFIIFLNQIIKFVLNLSESEKLLSEEIRYGSLEFQLDISLSIIAICLTIAQEQGEIVKLIQIEEVERRILNIQDKIFRSRILPKIDFLKQFLN